MPVLEGKRMIIMISPLKSQPKKEIPKKETSKGEAARTASTTEGDAEAEPNE